MTWTIEKADGWPFPTPITDNRKAGRKVWVEVTHADYWSALEALPPLYLPGAFAMGEAATHDGMGKAVHTVYIETSGRYFATDLARREYDEARRGLFAALKAEQHATA